MLDPVGHLFIKLILNLICTVITILFYNIKKKNILKIRSFNHMEGMRFWAIAHGWGSMMEGRILEAARFLTYPYYFLTMTTLNFIYLLRSKVYRVIREIKAQYPLFNNISPKDIQWSCLDPFQHLCSKPYVVYAVTVSPLQPPPSDPSLPTYQNVIKKRNKNI